MNKVVYKCDSFVDYKGTKVNFILAAVSIPCDNVIVPVDDCGCVDEEQWENQVESPKILSIGMAIQHPTDTWDEELGKEIAYGKAIKKRDHILATTDSGLINTKVVEALVEQEAAYMHVNPGRYIAGYDDAKNKYLKRKAQDEYINSLTDEEKVALTTLAKVKEPEKFLEAVEVYKNRMLAIADSGNIPVNPMAS